MSSFISIQLSVFSARSQVPARQMLSGPVAPYATAGSDFVVRAATRVRPEGQDNTYKGQQGSVGMLLQIEGTGISSVPARRTKQEPKDHMRENIRRMRLIQKASKKREEDSKQPVKALWKTSKFENVGSRVRDEMERPNPSRPQSANSFLRAHSRTGWTPVPRRPASACETEVRVRPEKLTVPRAISAREIKFERNDVDFIKTNGMAARHVGMKRSPSLTALDDLKKKQDEEEKRYQRGQVPKYLVNRQRTWEREEQERIANTPDPDLPPGHKIMPKSEQRETLEKLKASQRTLLNQLSKLPVRTDTLRLRTQKNEYESKLAEVEEAIKIFSRPKVFVAIDH